MDRRVLFETERYRARNQRRKRLPNGEAWPGLFLFTDDQRLPDPLPAIRQLPRGAGVVFRHYGGGERKALARTVSLECRRRGLILLVALDPTLAVRVGAHGVHLPAQLMGRAALIRQRTKQLAITAAVHTDAEAVFAKQLNIDAVFVSPVFPTQSHPAAESLGPLKAAALARQGGRPSYALGGIQPTTMTALKSALWSGTAGISLFTSP